MATLNSGHTLPNTAIMTTPSLANPTRLFSRRKAKLKNYGQGWQAPVRDGEEFLATQVRRDFSLERFDEHWPCTERVLDRESLRRVWD